MQTLLHRVTIYIIFIILTVLFSLNVKAVVRPFEIQVFDGGTKETQPYTLTSGKRYRLQAATSDNSVLPAEWFLSGNLGRITTDISPILTAVFVGEGSLICRVDGIEQRVQLSVLPETKTIGNSGGKLQSPAGVAIELPAGALAIEHKIGIEIVAPARITAPVGRVFNPEVHPNLTRKTRLKTARTPYIFVCGRRVQRCETTTLFLGNVWKKMGAVTSEQQRDSRQRVHFH